jgi:hypothetical protein
MIGKSSYVVAHIVMRSSESFFFYLRRHAKLTYLIYPSKLPLPLMPVAPRFHHGALGLMIQWYQEDDGNTTTEFIW